MPIFFLFLLLLPLSLFSFEALPENLPFYKITTEKELSKIYKKKIEPHFTRGEDSYFRGENNISIHYMAFTVFHERGSIVISNGRTEAIVKYKELIYDLNQNGYSLFLIDHRGQGFSGRMNVDQQMGHVDDFNNYIYDLHRFVTQKVKPRKPKYLYLLGHSMGGAIAVRYLEMFDDGFDATVLTSPMLQPNLFTANTSTLLCKVMALKKDKKRYAPGQKDYDKERVTFKDNLLTHSKLRFDIAHQEMAEHPYAKIGGPSVGWVQNACKASVLAVEEAEKIKVPLLVLRGSEDKIVNPKAEDTFCQSMGGLCRGYEIEGAWHELLVEKDRYRSETLQAILTFFDLLENAKERD